MDDFAKGSAQDRDEAFQEAAAKRNRASSDYATHRLGVKKIVTTQLPYFCCH